MTITVTTEPCETTLRHAGQDHPVAVSANGRFSLRYRGERFEGPSLASVKASMEQLEGETQAKRERAKALKEAAANPLPALYGDALEPVGVRGIDQRSGRVLITRRDGSSDSAPSNLLYRVLEESEAREFLGAAQAYQAARERSEATRPPGRYTFDREHDLVLRAEFDPSAGVFTCALDDHPFRAETLNDLKDQVLNYLMLQHYPVRLTDDGVIYQAEIDSDRHDDLFPTVEAAEAYLAAKAARSETSETFSDLRKRFAFDLSPLTESEGQS